jgi:hypothetical protein
MDEMIGGITSKEAATPNVTTMVKVIANKLVKKRLSSTQALGLG